jgi:hypothetical protein
MKRVTYRLDNDVLDVVETTSEYLLIEYTDDEYNTTLKLESHKYRKDDEDGDSR